MNHLKSSDAKSSRKRTKTGCQTCRRRRIKCGEERPNCQNCTKSKRDCQGYNQPVIFKEPLSVFRPPASISRLLKAAPQVLQRSQFRQYEWLPQDMLAQQDGQVSQETASKAAAPNFSGSQTPTNSMLHSVPIMYLNYQTFFHSYHPESSYSTTDSSPDATAPFTPAYFQASEDFSRQVEQIEHSQVQDSSQIHARSLVGRHYSLNDALGQLPGKEPWQQPQHQKQHSPGERYSLCGWNDYQHGAFHSTSYELLISSESSTSGIFHQSYPSTVNHASRPLGSSERMHEDHHLPSYYQEETFSAGQSRQTPFSPSL